MKFPIQSIIPIGFTNIPPIDENTIRKDLATHLAPCGEILTILIKVPLAIVVFNRKDNSKAKICHSLPLGPSGMFIGPNEIERINL